VCQFFFLICLAQQPPVGQGLLIHKVSRSHTVTHHSRLDSSGRVISSSQGPLPDNTQHSQHRRPYSRWDRTHSLSRRAAVDLRLRPRGHWAGNSVSIQPKIPEPLISKHAIDYLRRFPTLSPPAKLFAHFNPYPANVENRVSS